MRMENLCNMKGKSNHILDGRDFVERLARISTQFHNVGLICQARINRNS